MSVSYRPIQAFDFCKTFVKQMPLEDVDERILDGAHKMMWMAAPWRWTVGSFPSVTLASSTQDYTVAIPADFLYLLDAQVVTTDANNEQTVRTLDVEELLHTDVGITGNPSKVAVTGTPGQAGVLRIQPKTGTLSSGTSKLLGIYKKAATTVTRANSSTSGLLGFNDEWAWVYEEGVLYYAYKYADDPRAGDVKVDGTRYSFSGQRAQFEAALQIMREREKMPNFSTRTIAEPQADRR